MRSLGAFLVLLVVAAGVRPAAAQVTVEVVVDRPQYLSGESLPVAVRITNRSGQKLKFGTDEGWLTFSVETREGSIAVKKADVPVAGEFDLDPSKRAIKHIDLEPYFAIASPGRYLVSTGLGTDPRPEPTGDSPCQDPRCRCSGFASS